MLIREMRAGDMEHCEIPGIETHRQFEQAILTMGLGYVAEVGGEILALGGVQPAHPGTGEAWFIISPRLSERLRDGGALGLVRACRKVVTRAARAFSLHRVQAHTIAPGVTGYSIFSKFARACGFESEGVRRAWGTRGEDMEEWGFFPKQEF